MILKSKKQIVKELRLSADLFKSHGHIYTSRWITFIADNYEKNRLTDYQKDYRDVLDAFKSEVCKDDFTKKVHNEIDRVLGTALNVQREAGFNKILLKTYALIHDYVVIRKNIMSINQMLSEKYETGDIEKSFYVLCFQYLLEIEAGFENIIRVLYALVQSAKREHIIYREIFTKPLKDIEKEMGSEVFFLGWDNGHLRNAIAHAHFTFDEKEKRMNFVDTKPWNNKKVYEKSLSFEEFRRKGKMISEVTHIFIDYIMLIRLLDLIKHKWIGKRTNLK